MASTAIPPKIAASTHGFVHPVGCPPYGSSEYTMPVSLAISPIANRMLPSQSIFAEMRTPRSFCGKASLRIAEELANRNAPPTPRHGQHDGEECEDREAEVVHPYPAVNITDPSKANHQHRSDQHEPHEYPQEIRTCPTAAAGSG